MQTGNWHVAPTGSAKNKPRVPSQRKQTSKKKPSNKGQFVRWCDVAATVRRDGASRQTPATTPGEAGERHLWREPDRQPPRQARGGGILRAARH